jgi:phage terminase small subunit
MFTKKDERFLLGKRLGGRPAVVESRVTAPVKPHKQRVLTPQEWRFVEEFCSNDGHVTLREAAIRAGYSDSWAKGRARELTDPEKNPHIVAAIQERRRELGDRYGTTFERHMRDLQLIRDQALQAGAYGAAVQAEYRRGQALGTIYVDRKEIRHGTIDSMSKEEVQRKLEEIRRLYGAGGGPIVDITPKQIEQDPEVLEMVSLPESSEEDENDADETGEPVIQAAPRKPRKLPYIPDRESD